MRAHSPPRVATVAASRDAPASSRTPPGMVGHTGSMTASRRPPKIDGTAQPRIRDVFRTLWWAEIGYWHSARRGRFTGRAMPTFLALAWWPTLLVLVVVQWATILWSPWSRHYMSPERDAIFGVRAGRGTWQLNNHGCSRPGTGQGQALRALIAPQLIAAADARGVAITATAAVPQLAEIYQAELPGLVDVGPGFPRGRRLRRDPQPGLITGVRQPGATGTSAPADVASAPSGSRRGGLSARRSRGR